MSQPSPIASEGWNPTAALAAWIFPGLGHFLLNERRRAAILGSTISVLFLTGLLIGGVSVVDRVEHPAWFAAQACCASSAAVGEYFQRLRKADSRPVPSQDPIYEPAFGKVQEQGTLYTALAGLLNLLCIIDVLYRDPSRRRLDSPGQQPPTTIDLQQPPSASLLLPLFLAQARSAAPTRYRPFLDPIPLDTYWLLLLPPIAIAIAVVYKTIKIDDLRLLPRQSLVFSAQIIAFMAMAAAAFWLVTELHAYVAW